jgi:hypothetical protein
MRKEDRKPSKRVFPLLQNLDLDTVTFSNVQGVGDSITIEDMNEQELQDLVLVNLARLVVSGEWTGLLEAGGGGEAIGSYAPVVPPMAGGDVATYQLPLPIANNISEVTNWSYGTPGVTTVLMFWPWTVQVSGTMDDLGVRVGSTAGDDLYIGFYDSDSTNFYPSGAPLFTTTVSTSINTNFVIDASSLGDVTAGDVLWLAIFGQVNKSKINCFDTGVITCAVPKIDSSLETLVHQAGLRLDGETGNTFPTITDAKEFESIDMPSVPALSFSVS